jgi:hypothetical protein
VRVDPRTLRYRLHVEPAWGTRLYAYRGQKPVAVLWWAGSGTVRRVLVSARFRRNGIATELWRRAHKLANLGVVSRPRHSVIRSFEGDAWARAVGGHVPRTKPVDLTLHGGIRGPREWHS